MGRSLLRAYQGEFEAAREHLEKTFSLLKETGALTSESTAWSYRALCHYLAGDAANALQFAQQARILATQQNYERDIIRAQWLLGLISVHLARGEEGQSTELLLSAEHLLKDALSRCRKMNMVDYEADLLIALAKLWDAKGQNSEAKANALEALAITTRSEFRVLRADIHNVLAQLELDEKNGEEAQRYAQAALNDAICDGPPSCYLRALKEARNLIERATSCS